MCNTFLEKHWVEFYYIYNIFLAITTCTYKYNIYIYIYIYVSFLCLKQILKSTFACLCVGY